MSINYNTPTTAANFNQALNANSSITPATQLAINSALGITSPSTPVNVGDYTYGGTNQTPRVVDAAIVNIPSDQGTPVNLGNYFTKIAADAGGSIKAYIIQSNGNIIFTFNPPSPQQTSAPSGETQGSNNKVLASVHSASAGEATSELITKAINKAIAAGATTFQLSDGGADATFTGNIPYYIAGGKGDNKITLPGMGDNTVQAGTLTNTIKTGAGQDTIIYNKGVTDNYDAGAGWDNAILSGAPSSWTVTKTGGNVVLTASDGTTHTVTLNNVQFVEFTNPTSPTQHSLAIATGTTAANVLQLYQSAWNMSPENSANAKAAVDFVTTGGGTLAQATEYYFLQGGWAQSNYGMSNEQFVKTIYHNIYGVDMPDTAVKAWADLINAGQTTRTVFVDAATTAQPAQDAIHNVVTVTGWV